MARHRRLPTLQGQLRRALARTLAITTAAAVLVIGGAGAAYVSERGDGVPDGIDPIGEPVDGPERRLMAAYDCSSQGYAESDVPRSALVRKPGGSLAVVDFDTGWRLHTGSGATELVAVCLRPAD